MRILLLSFFIALSSSLLAQAYKNIGAVEFKQLIEKNDGVILDIRTTREFNSGHIAGAKLYSLQDPQVAQKLAKLPKDKPLYLYCYSGARSRTAANFLAQNGYTKVYNLQRGIIDWKGNSFPLVKPNGTNQPPQKGQFTVASFNKAVTASPVVFVDFYAPWCAPCKRMMPYVDALSKEYAGKIKVVKVNADASGDLVKSKGIRGVPYLALYENGQQVFTKDGAMTEAELRELFARYSK